MLPYVEGAPHQRQNPARNRIAIRVRRIETNRNLGVWTAQRRQERLDAVAVLFRRIVHGVVLARDQAIVIDPAPVGQLRVRPLGFTEPSNRVLAKVGVGAGKRTTLILRFHAIELELSVWPLLLPSLDARYAFAQLRGRVEPFQCELLSVGVEGVAQDAIAILMPLNPSLEPPSRALHALGLPRVCELPSESIGRTSYTTPRTPLACQVR